jgi:hypothetical protein
MRAIVVLLAGTLVACEGVPDITFAEAGASGDAGDGSADGSSDSGADADASCPLLQGATACCGANSFVGDCAGSCGNDCKLGCDPATMVCCYPSNGNFQCNRPGAHCH